MVGIEKGKFVVAMTADIKKCLHATIVPGEAIRHWGKGKKAGMVAGVPGGKVRWRIVGLACTAKA